MAKIPNLPAAGKAIAFKLSRQSRVDLLRLRTALAGVVGEDKPLRISEVIRLCIRFTAERTHEFNRIAEMVNTAQAGKT